MLDANFYQGTELKNGDLIVSEPFLSDPNFTRAVILICEHSEGGSFGLMLNKVTDITVADATEELMSENTLYVGGPVEQNTLHFIHTLNGMEGSVPLKDGVFWGGDYKAIKEYVINGLVNEQNCRFFVGYSGWSENQLQEELTQNTWIVSQENLASVLQMDPQGLWKELLRNLGGKYHVFSNYPLDPRSN